MTVRTRIAPSPTGDPHVGTAYIALFNMVFAKSRGGQFLLRIEDTDQLRSTRESEQQILDSLRWLGLDWDEGPDIGGPHGPYRQSERGELYRQHAAELVERGHAFHCFCTPERLDTLRREQEAKGNSFGYDGHCLHLSQQEVQARLAAGEPHVIRMKVPREGHCKVLDMLRGEITIDWQQVDMQVLVKADGLPTYHLANVVDDHYMQISHVIRGEEWISSAPKHILLYQYLGWEMPVLCHMPLLRNPDQSKLSKRKNPTCITYYRDAGYLPEALLNYLGRMGWSMPDEQEQFSLQQMIDNFDLKRISLGGPIFDQQKLSWLNSSWIRGLTIDQFAERLRNWRMNDTYFRQFLGFAKERASTFTDIAPMAAFMFSGQLDLSAEQFDHKKLEPGQVRKILQFILWRLDNLRLWNKETIFAEIKTLSQQLDLKIGDCMQPVFVAIAGTPNSWSVVDSMGMLGPDMSRARLRHGVQVLGGLSKKELKRLEKEFKTLNFED